MRIPNFPVLVSMPARSLSPAQLQKLRRWNTPSVANALEQISGADPLTLFNLEETRDFMPELGPMMGVAMTVVISGGDPRPKREQPENFNLYREYLASRRGPKIVVVQDADRPVCYGSIWGEVGATQMRALGCVGTITEGRWIQGPCPPIGGEPRALLALALGSRGGGFWDQDSPRTADSC